MVYCSWCVKCETCKDRRTGPTVCGEFVSRPGVFPYHTFEDLPPEKVEDAAD